MEVNDTMQDIKEFDPDDFIEKIDAFTIMVLAPRRTGKTVLVTDLISEFVKKRKYEKAYLFSQTATAQTKAYTFIPKANRHDNLNLEVVNSIFKDQEKNKLKYEHGQIREPVRVLIIADDVTGTKESRDKDFNKIFTTGRHFYIDLFVLGQAFKSFAPVARTNSDLIILWRSLKLDDRINVIDDYLTVENGKRSDVRRMAEELLNFISEVPYRAMVINVYKSNSAKHLGDYVNWYLANDKAKVKFIGDKKENTMTTTHEEEFKTFDSDRNTYSHLIRLKLGKQVKKHRFDDSE